MTQPSSTYRSDIDGLRGIAVSCVILFHAGEQAPSGKPPASLYWYR